MWLGFGLYLAAIIVLSMLLKFSVRPCPEGTFYARMERDDAIQGKEKLVSLGCEEREELNVSVLRLNLTGGSHSHIAHFFKGCCSKIKMMSTRLATLRSLMASQPPVLAAYIIPTADAHNSEYIAPVDARREWISGFTGSAGTAVVTQTRALVWTDGRYYTQFQKETNPELWTLMKQSLPETPTIEKWLASNLAEGAVVGFDPHTLTRDEFTPIETALTKAQMHFVAVQKNLVDEARRQLNDPAPSRPFNNIVPHTPDYSGNQSGEKIMELRKQLKEKKAAALVITALDEIAYILNLRGSDIEYNPVFFSYLVVTPAAVKLFWNDGKLPSEVTSHLADEGLELEVYSYNCIEEHLKKMATELSEKNATHPSIWLPSDASEAIHRAAAGVAMGPKSLSTASLRKMKQQEELTKPLTLISEVSPIALMKLVKNSVELEGFRACHVRDGAAVVRFLHWLHAELHRGAHVTEIQAADKLLSFRKEEEDFVGPSFETIAAAGENGAIIHYSPKRDGEQRAITTHDMFLLDSGGQYKDGTTDITRTRHMGSPSEEQRDAFTRVLKGQIMLGAALFPKGVKGNVLDSFARKALWDVGMDYAHGTGHGVGHYLNVHEGPSGVSWRPYPHDPGLKPGQILSNEPGFYKVGEYGIRHEDLVETIAVDRGSHNHPRSSTLKDDFAGRGVLGFHTLTLVPHQQACIDVRMLDHFELAYLNAYHERVLKTVGPRLMVCDAKAYEWLVAECAPLYH